MVVLLAAVVVAVQRPPVPVDAPVGRSRVPVPSVVWSVDVSAPARLRHVMSPTCWRFSRPFPMPRGGCPEGMSSQPVGF